MKVINTGLTTLYPISRKILLLSEKCPQKKQMYFWTRSKDKLDDHLTLHSLRASCVSILIHMGVDIKDVQKWVGHSDIQTTLNIYAQTNQKQQDKTMNHMVDALLLAGGSEQNS